MPYVARYTLNPDYDVVRRWTGYMGCDALTPEMVAEHILDTHGMPFPARVKIDGEWIDWDETPWGWRIDWVLERADIRLHEPSGLWMWVHNPDGLSCWPLQAETPEAAIEEARALDADNRIQWHGFGHVTRGRVEYVGPVTGVLHVFWCEDTAPEK